jgi:hypothetical protein
MILAPSPVQQFVDNNNNLLVGGLLFVYAAGTTTKQAAFTDASGATALPDPVVLNARGEVAASSTGTSCGLWLDPTLAYKLVLAPATDSDPPTHPFWTIDNIVSPQSAILAAVSEYQASLGGTPIGGMIAYGGAAAPPGWLLCYGQAVSRTSYALLFAILGIDYGAGDGSTTFNLPDKRGRMSIGADNMGGSAANRVTQAVSGILATTVGQAGGNQLAQQDTLTATTTVSVGDPGHQHTAAGSLINGTAAPGASTGAGGVTTYPQPIAEGFITNAASTGISATAATTVTSALTGASQNMPPAEVDNWIIYTGTTS